MRLYKLISPIVCLALLAFSDLAGVVKKQDLWLDGLLMKAMDPLPTIH